MITRSILLLATFLALLTACRPRTEPSGSKPDDITSPEVEAAALKRGQAIAAQAFGLLSTNLVQAIAAGGVTNALPYCSEKAFPLTELVASTNQVAIRRVTHRPRNPTNEASAAELNLLRGFQLALGRGEKPSPVVRALSARRVVFYSPIVITNPLCLQCHGTPGQDITPAAVSLLGQLYPQDQATGFKLGDLRGAWRIELPREP